MADNAKRAALIAEGLSEGEADYMTSGGTKSEGLTPVVEGDATPEPAKTSDAPAGTQPAATGAAPPITPPVPEPDEDEPPTNTPIPYPKYKREKDRLTARVKEFETRATTAETERNQERERMARLGERLANLAVEQPATPAAEVAKPTPPPDPEADPIGYIKHLGEQFTALAGKTEKVETTVQERDASTALERSYVDDARQFVSRQPDFGQAYTWLMKNRDAELYAAGVHDEADPEGAAENPALRINAEHWAQERHNSILGDERDIVARALTARQKNPNAAGPTQVLYRLAKSRGYGVTAPVAPATPAPPNGAAQPAPAANGAPAPQTVTQQVEAIERGRNASRSLSSGGGAPPPVAIDISKMLDMNDNEWGEYKRSLTPAQRVELAGLMGAPGR